MGGSLDRSSDCSGPSLRIVGDHLDPPRSSSFPTLPVLLLPLQSSTAVRVLENHLEGLINTLESDSVGLGELEQLYLNPFPAGAGLLDPASL